ncbi:hypothetical protein SAMN04487917_101212 [Arthrobacter sp. yr096]|uniref:hypothetical protein n=1 Tax=Arthrobacter sp. yr096 TaxID=1761750 RepID=UPI0008D125DE|nr:hypothetical protein [Arthrobacter sp. yr096]SEI42585.1 hypothetical protein SAMN04487917_101212 [Arthrobacter sp. yr096]
MTAAPGWYPPPDTPRPLLATDQAVGNPFIWLLACLPFGVGSLMVSWNPEVHKVAPRRGLWPIAVIVAAWGLYIVAGVAKALPFMQSVFYELGY